MTRIDVTPIEEMHAHLVRENVALRELVAVLEGEQARADALAEENAKIREVNAEQAKHIGDLREQLRQAQQRERARMARSGE